jgi:hypothetical protein
VLTPLGLSQNGAALSGERHGRRVSVSIDARGSTTKVRTPVEPPAFAPDAIAGFADRGTDDIWEPVTVEYEGDAITVRRRGHAGAAWLWDLWLAERLAGTE